jgi:hypothetical protein
VFAFGDAIAFAGAFTVVFAAFAVFVLAVFVAFELVGAPPHPINEKPKKLLKATL